MILAMLEGTFFKLHPTTRPTVKAVELAAMRMGEAAQMYWRNLALSADVRATGRYIAGLEGKGSLEHRYTRVKKHGDVWLVEVRVDVVARAPHSEIVEKGHTAFHLPSKVNWSGERVKRAKDGTRYLHIPFRHRAYADEGERQAGGYTRASRRSMMPEHIYEQAKQLAFTVKQNEGPIHHKGQFVAADRYQRGFREEGGEFKQVETDSAASRLKRDHTRPSFIMGGGGHSAGGPGEPGFEEHRGARTVGHTFEGPGRGTRKALSNPEWQTSKYHGMIRSGSPRHSQYLTIRTMVEGADGWNIPAQAGHHFAEKTKVAAPLMFSQIATASLRGAFEVQLS